MNTKDCKALFHFERVRSCANCTKLRRRRRSHYVESNTCKAADTFGSKITVSEPTLFVCRHHKARAAQKKS